MLLTAKNTITAYVRGAGKIRPIGCYAVFSATARHFTAKFYRHIAILYAQIGPNSTIVMQLRFFSKRMKACVVG